MAWAKRVESGEEDNNKKFLILMFLLEGLAVHLELSDGRQDLPKETLLLEISN